MFFTSRAESEGANCATIKGKDQEEDGIEPPEEEDDEKEVISFDKISFSKPILPAEKKGRSSRYEVNDEDEE